METVNPPQPAISLASLFAPIEEQLDLVDTWITDALVGEHPRLDPLLVHLHKFRGKRVRAAQILLIAKASNSISEYHIPLAGIVELIHAATLVHDDLLDEASQRRRLDCVHVEWGSHSAVLLGDWIYAKAFEHCTRLPGDEASLRLARATRRVCAGEIFQNLTRKDFDLSEEDYLLQIDGKTGALFEEGCHLAAAFAGTSETTQRSCALYGKLAGRAFQMADDLLDLVGKEETAGKSLGTDWARGKMTLPLIHLRDRLSGESLAALKRDFGSGGNRQVLFENNYGKDLQEALEVSRKEISRCLASAAEALQILAPSPARHSLISLTHFLGTRNQ